jgi:hypothetical protein
MEFFVYENEVTGELAFFRKKPIAEDHEDLRYLGVGRIELESDRGEVPWVARPGEGVDPGA